MTYATDAGFILGNKYKVVCNKGYFPEGDIVKFIEDDQTETPYFENQKGVRGYTSLKRLKELPTTKFQVGDKVVVVDPTDDLTAGEVLTVSAVKLNFGQDAVDVVDSNGQRRGGTNGFFVTRFELYVAPVEIPEGNTDFSIDQIGGATTIRVQRELTSAELQAVVKILKG